MLAEIIPITRLPRPLGVFDYLVPKELAGKIEAGQLVTIPFRKSEIFGLVLNHESQARINTPTPSIKAIKNLVIAEPLIAKRHLKFLQTLSQWYGVSLGTLAPMSLLPLQKKKLQQLTINNWTKANNQTLKPSPCYHFYHNQSEHKIKLTESLRSVTLILVPEIYLIDEVHRLLPLDHQQQTVIWHSRLSVKQRFERWLQVRNGDKTIVLGTRSAILLPIPNLKTIIIDYEHDDNHKHWDQAPRFHVKDIAALIATLSGATLHLMSYAPSLEAYYQAKSFSPLPAPTGKGKPNSFATNAIDSRFHRNDIRIINLAEERRAGRYGLVADEVKEAILGTTADIFIFINRLGFATSLGCNACGYVTRCANCQLPLVYHQKTHSLHCHYCSRVQPITPDCPRCKNRVIELRGAGTEFVANGVHTLFGEKLKHEIIRIDSEVAEELNYTPKPRIVVGTTKSLRHIRWDKTELIIYLGLDHELGLPEYRATERVWQTIQEMLFRKEQSAQLYLQTFNPTHLIFPSLAAPDRFYCAELESRRRLGYPPYQYLVRYCCGHRDWRTSKKEAERLLVNIKNELTKSKKRAKLSHAIEMQPYYWRGNYWYVIIGRLEPNHWQEDLVWLNQLIPPNWKIDPNPISLLSP